MAIFREILPISSEFWLFFSEFYAEFWLFFIEFWLFSGRIPLMWAQSLYVISQLLRESFIACGELDPINRRLSSFQRPEVIVQVVVLAKDQEIKDLLAEAGVTVRTLKEASIYGQILMWLKVGYFG